MASSKKPRVRPAASQSGDAPPDTPTSVDGVEIALDVEKDDPAHDSGARVLLGKQAKLVDADLAFRDLQCRSEKVRYRNERVSLLLRQLTVVVGLAFALGVACIFVSAVRARGVVVEAFDAPPSLGPSGINGQVMASRIQDALTEIQDRTRTTAVRQSINNAWTSQVAVQIPQTGLSIGEVSAAMRRAIGHETYVSGSLVINPDDSLSLIVRGTGIPPRSFAGPRDALDRLITQGAEYLFGWFEPRLFATYLRQSGRGDEVEAFVRGALPRAETEEQTQLMVERGLVQYQAGRNVEAIYSYRQAIRQDPSNWRAWNALVSATRRERGPNAAWQIGRELAAVPGSDGAEAIAAWYNYKRLAQDWTGQTAIVEANQRQAGAAGSMTGEAGVSLADSEAHRYDWAAVARLLDNIDPSNPWLPGTRLYFQGLRLLDAGRPREAAALLERFHRIWSSDAALARQFEFAHCEVGHAFALAGRGDEAMTLFRSGLNFPQCRAFAADAAEAAGNRATADRRYRAAIGFAPDIPFAWHRWGLALLARGDLAGAEARFARAHAQGPNWADPLKGLGDVHAARGQWQEAAHRYRQALAFAPGWIALRQTAEHAEVEAARRESWLEWLF